ncbi:MAG TPA: hypothetical protein VGJ96_00490 [Gemmatimonadaceae bacterium]|jgi:hypothetical protein
MRMGWVAVMAMGAVTLGAQSPRAVTVRVTTSGGQPVPYALLSVDGTPDRIADARGGVTLVLPARDSVRVSARRIGFRPLDGWARRAASDDAFEATMMPIAATMDTIRVIAAMVTPLSKTGFYDRVERVQKSAMLGEFITPEELGAKNYSRLSEIMQGRQYSHIAMKNSGARSQPVLQGRGRCPLNIVVDGHPVKNTIQDEAVSGVPLSIMSRGSSQITGGNNPIGLDEIVDGRSIMGIEIYPSTANAPAELIPMASRGGCGLVAIWTGPRK